MHNLAFALQEWIDAALAQFDWRMSDAIYADKHRLTDLYLTCDSGEHLYQTKKRPRFWRFRQTRYHHNDSVAHVYACLYTDRVFKAMGLSWAQCNWNFYQLVYSTYFMR
jgi:hypothetical protein